VTAGLRHVYSGKVRELYETPDGVLLLVATDRISAFDWVLQTEIPDKGRILTQLSLWWFRQLADIVPNHLVDSPVPAEFAGRAMACQKLSMVPFECVARGYLAGSAVTEYQASGVVCGHQLRPGLSEGSRLPQPLFTPATKAPRGEHDLNVPVSVVADSLGADVCAEIERITLQVYQRGTEIAEPKGIIVADTKIELGFGPDGALMLADEVLTPDSSRFWPADQWSPGRSQPALDKQYVRDWLTSPESGWDRASGQQPPPLPQEVVERTRDTYVQAYEGITGLTWGIGTEDTRG
jgi:phosphoribosylaminoimidazole-succinocarboxamide synthase